MFALNNDLGKVAPQNEVALKSLDGSINISIYNNALYIKHDIDKTKDYYAELIIGLSGITFMANSSNGFYRREL